MTIKDKKNFGQLQAFKNVIVFAHDNGKGQSGGIVDADLNEIRPVIRELFKARKDVRELFRQCVDESTGIIIAH